MSQIIVSNVQNRSLSVAITSVTVSPDSLETHMMSVISKIPVLPVKERLRANFTIQKQFVSRGRPLLPVPDIECVCALRSAGI